MTPSTDLSAEELRERVRTAAHLLAARSYRAADPGATDDEAHAYADRHWRTFRAAAVDFLALAEADRRAREAAPRN